jgi:hypothetical protein
LVDAKKLYLASGEDAEREGKLQRYLVGFYAHAASGSGNLFHSLKKNYNYDT